MMTWSLASVTSAHTPSFGNYQRLGFSSPSSVNKKAAFPVYHLAAQAERRGVAVLSPGAYTNHRGLAGVPQVFASQGWDTYVVPFPEWDNPQSQDSFQGGKARSAAIVEGWRMDLPSLTQHVIERARENAPSHEPVILGGHSMGASGIVHHYHHMDSATQALISGFLLMSPAFQVRGLGPQGSLKDLFFRHFVLGVLQLGKTRKEEGVDPAIASEMDTQRQRSAVAMLASGNFIHETFRMATTMSPVTAPTLLIHSRGSDPTVADSSFDLAMKVFPNAQEVFIPNARHHPHAVAGREKVHEVIGDFVSSKAFGG